MPGRRLAMNPRLKLHHYPIPRTIDVRGRSNTCVAPALLPVLATLKSDASAQARVPVPHNSIPTATTWLLLLPVPACRGLRGQIASATTIPVTVSLPSGTAPPTPLPPPPCQGNPARRDTNWRKAARG